MQFREQGKKIQCIRSAYDPASKRSHQKVVAAFDRWADKLESVDLTELTEGERQELAAWFGARQAVRAESTNKWRARSGGQTLADLAESIRAAESLTDDQAAAIWQGLADVAKAMRKAGHPKPQRERTAPVVAAGQADLLADVAAPDSAPLPPVSTPV